jgi:hypothetical protein
MCWNKIGSTTINLENFDGNKAVKRANLCTNSLLSVQKIIKEKRVTLRKEMKRRLWTLNITWTLKSETLDSGLGEDPEQVKF